MKFFLLCFLAFHLPQLVLADEGIVAVTARAERAVEPNLLVLNLEVWAQAKTAKQAQQMAAQQFKDLQKSFAVYGIAKSDIQTENYSLNPNYEYNQKTQRNQMTGFRVSQGLLVTLRKTESAGAFLDSVAAGTSTSSMGLNIQNIQWSSTEKDKIQQELLTEAVKSARAQADILALASGTKIKSVKRLQPYTGSAPEPRMERAYALKAADAAVSTELSPGQVKVQVEVSAEYQLK